MQTIKVRIPKYHLGDVPVERLPGYLSPVRAAADMLYGMALHPCGREGRDVVLSMIDQSIAELAEAREAISKLDTIVPVKDETVEEIKAGTTQLVLDVSRFDLETEIAASGEGNRRHLMRRGEILTWLSCKWNNFRLGFWQLFVRVRFVITGDCGLSCGVVTFRRLDGTPFQQFVPECDCPIHDLGLKSTE